MTHPQTSVPEQECDCLSCALTRFLTTTPGWARITGRTAEEWAHVFPDGLVPVAGIVPQRTGDLHTGRLRAGYTLDLSRVDGERREALAWCLALKHGRMAGELIEQFDADPHAVGIAAEDVLCAHVGLDRPAELPAADRPGNS